jgi:hypothetical protein
VVTLQSREVVRLENKILAAADGRIASATIDTVNVAGQSFYFSGVLYDRFIETY